VRSDLPAERTKNKRSHIVPLSEPARAILDAQRREGRVFVFGRGDGGFSGWSDSKRGLDERMRAAGHNSPQWTPHDIRRTVATRMADLGVQPHIIEAVLNHVSGHKTGVAGIYNRATDSTEKRRALDLWAEHVAALVEDRKAKIVSLRGHDWPPLIFMIPLSKRSRPTPGGIIVRRLKTNHLVNKWSFQQSP
jgi:hypothetical protein